MKVCESPVAIPKVSRRTWLKSSAATVAAGSLLAGLDVARFAHAAGSDVAKIGLVGCGNRGTGACQQALNTPGPVKLVAVGDLFAERIEQSLKNLLKHEELRERIDVANWVVGDHPLRAQGMGGRQVRTGVGTGDIFDHHAIEFEYADGVRYFCQARQQPGTWTHVSDNVHGTKGSLTIGTGAWGMGATTPRELRSKHFRGDNPYQREHNDLMASVRGSGPYRFEGDYAATSSMTAVMGRMATYGGQMIAWDEATRSTLALAPERYAMDAMPPAIPNAEGLYPVAIPGVSKAL